MAGPEKEPTGNQKLALLQELGLGGVWPVKGETEGLLRQGLGVLEYSKDMGPVRNIV